MKTNNEKNQNVTTVVTLTTGNHQDYLDWVDVLRSLVYDKSGSNSRGSTNSNIGNSRPASIPLATYTSDLQEEVTLTSQVFALAKLYGAPPLPATPPPKRTPA